MTNPTTDEQLPELPDSVRVPLDELWADAEYLIARVVDKTLDQAAVVALIKQRIDDGKNAAREAIAAVVAERDALLADALRWRHIRDECAYSYGDGHTEPVEHGIHLDWMQGAWIRDESNGGIGRPDTFPGWNSLVDNLISNLATELTEDDALDAAMKGVGG